MARAPSDYYRIGIQKLLEAIGPNHRSYADALILQLRLEENLSETDRFGEDSSRQAQRAQIPDGCNRLSVSATGRSFNYFCGLPEPPTSPRAVSELLQEATRFQLAGDLGYALQLYRQVQQLDPTYPRIDALIADVEQEMGASYVGPGGLVNKDRLFDSCMREPQAERRAHPPPPPSTRARLSPISTALWGLVAITVVVLLTLLCLWLRGMLSYRSRCHS